MAPNDITRCADGLAGQCPQAGRCERTAPVPAGEIVSQAFYNGLRLARGWCADYLPIPERCTEEE
jgi:hypothetical protein